MLNWALDAVVSDPDVDLSFVILTYRRPEMLLRCLRSLAEGMEPERMEAVVGINGEDRETLSLLRRISLDYPWLRWTSLERAPRGEARNRLVSHARGRILYFLDDDVEVPAGFADRALEKFRRHASAYALGGPNLAPPGSDAFQRAADFLFRSPLGAGPMRIRFIRKGQDRPLPGWGFTLSNLGARREVFERHGIRFPENCVSAEENLFLCHLEKRLAPPVYSPDLHVHHHRRGSTQAFCRQIFQNAKGRGQITRISPASLQPVVLLPTLGLIYLFALPSLPALLWAPGLLYASACLLECARLAVLDKDPRAALRLPILIPLAHLSYALGLLAGLLPGFRRPPPPRRPAAVRAPPALAGHAAGSRRAFREAAAAASSLAREPA